jgi:cytoskeletal protein CcmA (bactofilin family)
MAFSNHHTLVARGTKILGDLYFSGDLHVEGEIQGNIILASDAQDAKVVISEKGQVNGEIRVPSVVINGHVTGDVYASKHLELASKAVVTGNVYYKLIEMVKGSQVNGNLVRQDFTENPSAELVKKAKAGKALSPETA